MNKLTRNKLFLGILTFGLITNLLVLLDVQYFYLRAIFSFIFLTTIPGLLIMLMLKPSKISFWEYLVYTIGLSIAFIMFAGLALNWILPWIHITNKPLSLNPLVSSFGLILSIFGIIAYKRNQDISLKIKLPKLDWVNKIFFITPAIFLLLSILGTLSLNNGGPNYLTMLMLGGIAVYVFLIAFLRDKLNEHVFPWAILLTSVSLLLMYSLRSWHIIGWDIHQELSVFQTTLAHQNWNINYFPGEAYNACLSITILPTILSKFIHISDEYILKITFNIIFAFVPVGIYILVNKYLKRWSAFLAVFFFISQVWFYEQMPAITRQEIGIFYYVLTLLILLNKNLGYRLKSSLFYLFSAGLIVSHYSTAYIWLVQMGIVVIASYLFTFLRMNNFNLNFIKPSMLIISLILLFLWEVVITQSYSNSYKTIAGSKDHLLEAFLPSKLENSLITVLYGTPNVNTTKNVQLKYKEAEKRSIGNNYKLYSKNTYKNYIPFAIDDKKVLLSKLPNFLSESILLISKICKALSSYLLLYLGFGALLILQLRKKTQKHTDLVLLTLSGFSLILLMLVMPNLQANYNFSRLYMQALVLACILPIVSANLILVRISKYQTTILTIILVTSFIFTTGFIEQFTGGFARTTLDQPNGTFDTFYVYDTEVKSAEWLSKNNDYKFPVFADILAGMRLNSYGKIKSNPDLFPNSISRDGYIYLSNSNVKRGHGFTKFDNNTIVFNYPTKFLDDEKNLIYNNGGSKIYK